MSAAAKDPAARRRRAVALVTVLLGAGLLAGAWIAVEPSRPAFALVVTMMTVGLVPFLGEWAARHLPRPAVAVASWEGRIFRWMGVWRVIRILDAVGWNRAVGRGAGAISGREGLRDLDRSTRGSIAAHGIGALIHLVLAGALAAIGHLLVAALVLLGGAVFHAYPVMIQRAVRLRLAPVLARAHAHPQYLDSQGPTG